jgi:ATP-dependent helicase/nuclease subunit A
MVLSQSGPMDVKLARALMGLDLDAPGPAEMEALEQVLVFKRGANARGPKSVPTKALKKAHSALFEPLLDIAQRAADLRPQRIALLAAEQALALSDFARVFLPLFGQAKARRGWLDFDDLIERAEALLTDPSVAAWVLFRLDGGIDHILVDEAQDTSPNQWRVIDLLTAEFTAGQGARGVKRTLFVVGDKKQSIYSFQGADVSGFDARNGQFQAAFQAVGLAFENRDLRHSFRSSPVILNVVDALFGSRYPDALGPDVRHIAFHEALPGRVELWPVVVKADDAQDKDDWTDPVDRTSPQAPVVVLAQQIAQHIRGMLERGAARPGDFLILVRRRSGVFPHLLRACKAAGLPVAGADRLLLSDELAVRDLLALLSVLALPEDDLALASVLRSPLCGWSEAELFDLAYARKGFLWQALRQKGGPALEMISDLRDQADFLRPHDLLDRALTRHRGRVRLLARLGEEAEEAIDALLAQALAYEAVEVPSLDGFLAWMQGDDAEIKRQMGEAQDRIRIMTVHGAKGLEGEIVILPDTGDRAPRTEATVLLDAGGLPVWTGTKDDRAPEVAALVEAKKAREAEESLRLLYVALTRAKSQLIVAAAGEAGAESWHGLVAQALTDLGAKADDAGRLVLQSADWAPGVAKADTVKTAGTVTLPDWARARVAGPVRQTRALSPSALGGAKALPGSAGDADATARGTALHLLLQHLPGQPQPHWSMLARALVPDAALRDSLLPVAAGLILDPALAPVFGPGSLAEVTIAGFLAGRAAEGAIDRLVVGKGAVLAVDFKSNPMVPANPDEVPESILRQMGAYAALLAPVYPGRAILTAVLWTQTGQLMRLPDEIVRAALQRATSDGALALDVSALDA